MKSQCLIKSLIERIFLKVLLFTYYFWLPWVFVAVRAFPQLQRARAPLQLRCLDFSLWWLLLLRSMGSRVCGLQQLQHMGSIVVASGLQNTGSVVVELGLSCSVACSISLDQGIKPMSPALADGFFTTELPGKLERMFLR